MSDEGFVVSQLTRFTMVNGLVPIGAENKNCCRCERRCFVGCNRGWLVKNHGNVVICPDCQTPEEKEEYEREHRLAR